MTSQSEKILTLIDIVEANKFFNHIHGIDNCGVHFCNYFWSARLLAKRGPYPMKIDIGFTICSSKHGDKLKNVWLAGTKDWNQENIELRDRLHAIGYDTTNLLEDLNPILIRRNIVKIKMNKTWIKKLREKIKRYKN